MKQLFAIALLLLDFFIVIYFRKFSDIDIPVHFLFIGGGVVMLFVGYYLLTNPPAAAAGPTDENVDNDEEPKANDDNRSAPGSPQ